MLEYLDLTNFQKHKRRRVTLDRYCTVFVGKSDAGKSALIRSLLWVCWNRPSHSGFIRHGAPFARVKLGVDGRVIVRRKGKQGNEYVVDGKVAKAVGSDVPESVARLLNIGPVCVARQHDAPWWFDKTPGQVSAELNAIVNLGVIDRTVTSLAADLRTAKSTLTVVQSRLAQAKSKAADLAWVPAAVQAAEAVTRVQTRLAEKKRSIARLDALLGDLQTAAVRRKELEGVLPDLKAAVQAGERVWALKRRLGTLDRTLTELADLRAGQRRHADRAAELKQEIKAALKSGCPLCGK